VNSEKKIIRNWSKLSKIIAKYRRQKKIIAFTNGCFDILHAGHVGYLEDAKKDNRILIVGLNSDASVKRIKGKDRPIVAEKYRAHVMAALACVDYVTFFHEETPLKIIETLKPNVLVKGADWKGKKVAGQEIVEKHGGTLEFIRYRKGFSTSQMIAKIKAADCS